LIVAAGGYLWIALRTRRASSEWRYRSTDQNPRQAEARPSHPSRASFPAMAGAASIFS
jgi:hypothetical protein